MANTKCSGFCTHPQNHVVLPISPCKPFAEGSARAAIPSKPHARCTNRNTITMHVRVHRPMTANRTLPRRAGCFAASPLFHLNVLPPHHKAQTCSEYDEFVPRSCFLVLRCIREMASSSRRSSPPLHHRYQYQMLPSKDDDALRVTEERGSSLANERDENVRGDEDTAKLSWKEQAKRDLKPSSHRDT